MTDRIVWWSIVISSFAVVYVQGLVTSHSNCGLVQKGCDGAQGFITGGVPTCAKAAPWNVLLENKADNDGKTRGFSREEKIQGFCGGSLVNNGAGDKTFVITAAHCLHNNRNGGRECPDKYRGMDAEQCQVEGCPEACLRTTASDIYVHLGRSTRRKIDNYIPPKEVRKVYIHPNYDRKATDNQLKNEYDIALLELYGQVQFSDIVWPICLPKYNDTYLFEKDDKLELYGYGRDLFSKDPYPTRLQTATFKVTSRQKCKDLWNIYGDQICIESDPDSVAAYPCVGDSGSGLVSKQSDDDPYVLLALVSFGEKTCLGAKPSVNTNVYERRDWIKQIIDGKQAPTECKTESGNKPNSLCKFPFKFQGKTFNECTLEQADDQKPWCSTSVDRNGVHRSEYWGHCGAGCPGVEKISTTAPETGIEKISTTAPETGIASCNGAEVCSECPQLITDFEEGRIPITVLKSKSCGKRKFCCDRR